MVDDGLATGSTARAALRSLRAAQGAHLVLAVPVAPCSAAESLRAEADQVVIVATPGRFSSVGEWYLAFGQLTLDLRSMGPLTGPRTVDITQAGGQVRLLLPKTLNASVHAWVHAGDVRVDEVNSNGLNDSGGFDYRNVAPAPAGATGPPLTINVHLAAGNVSIDHS